MIEIIIREPIWKNRSVGIAREKITEDLKIVISYKTATGELLYPSPFYMLREDALRYPTMTIKGHVLHIIPIVDMIKSIQTYEAFKQERAHENHVA